VLQFPAEAPPFDILQIEENKRNQIQNTETASVYPLIHKKIWNVTKRFGKSIPVCLFFCVNKTACCFTSIWVDCTYCLIVAQAFAPCPFIRSGRVRILLTRL